MAESKLDVILIIEILGKPADYLKEALSNLIEKLSKEKGVTLINKKIAEPKEVDKENAIYSSFVEVEIGVNDISTLMILIFSYMPSHIEIINPEFLNVKNYDLNMFFNELARRLHQYDEIAKITIMEKNILIKKLQELQKIQEISKQQEQQKKEEKTKDEITKQEKKKKSKKKN